MSRSEKRKVEREAKAIVKKAKADMQKWISSLQELPSEAEVRAWQSGYLSGINRIAILDEQDK